MSILSQPVTLSSVFGAKRVIGNITVMVIISELTTDTLTITKQPVQTGASITDHAYKEPTVLTMKILQQVGNPLLGIGNPFPQAGQSGLAQIYSQFLTLQIQRVPFNVTTPKRLYQNMLIAQISCDTDKHTENILSLSLTMQQVILVSIGTTQVPASRQKNPQATQATQNAGMKSAALTGTQAVLPGTVGFQGP